MPARVYKFILFVLGGKQWALPLGEHSHFFSPAHILALPWSPPALAALTYHQGQVVTLLDLRPLLSLSPAVGSDHLALTFSFNGDHYAVLVETAGEIIKTKRISRDRERPLFSHYLLLNKEPIYILDPAEIMAALHIYD